MTVYAVGVRLQAETGGFTGPVRQAKTELEQLGAAERGAAAAAAELTGATARAATGTGQVAAAARGAGTAMAGQARNVDMARAGYQQLGFQLQDVFAQYASGTRLTTIFALQAGQLASAVSLIGAAGGASAGVMGRFASFMGGPWGIAVGVGVSVLGALASTFMEADDAAEGASAAADAFTRRQADMANFIDKTTGRLAEQNRYLIQNAILLRQKRIDENTKTIVDERREAFKAADATRRPTFTRERAGFQTSYDPDVESVRERAGGNLFRFADGMAEVARRRPDLRPLAQDAATRAARSVHAARDSMAAQGEIDFLTGRRDQAPGFAAPKQSGGARKRRGGAAGTTADDLEDTKKFGDQAAESIARITAQFAEQPRVIAQASAATDDLDKIIKDLGDRKPPGFAAMIVEAEQAKVAVRESLTRPLDEFLRKAREGAEIDQLVLAGRDDEAEALQEVLRLQEQMGPLGEDQLATVLDTVRAERERSLVLRDQKALIQGNVQAVHDMRGALENTVAGMLRGRFSLKSIVSTVGNAAVTTMSQRVVEAMFGDTLRALELQANGQGNRLESAMDTGAEAVTDFASTVRAAIARIDSAATTSVGAAAGAGDYGQLQADFDAAFPAPITVAGKPAGGEGEATGEKSRNFVVGMVDQFLRRLGINLPAPLTDAVSKAMGRVEKSLPEIMKGAMIGAGASNLILGGGGSTLGGGIGGALGGKLGEKFLSKGLESLASGLGPFAGPLGSIAGGLIGGLLGGALKKTKTGTATIGNVDGQGEVAGTRGNSQSRISAARGLASSGLDALDQIVAQLGGDLGDFSASIGVRNKKFVVDPTGSGRTRGAGVMKFATEAEASAALLADVLADGAVKGVSAAVQKALKSDSDVTKAVAEALKVQELELAIGGVGAQLQQAFRDFERQARERLRIARDYGFDVVAIERKNADDRLALTRELLANQVGSLQQLVEEMTSGSLFEGSASERRGVLLTRIGEARAQADAGIEGAADTLARLYEDLNAVSKEVFGTTGGFAADRANILSGANASIAAANERIAQAQRATDPALTQTNAALDENNDQNARIIAALEANTALLQQVLATGSGSAGFDLARLAALAGTAA